MRRIIAAVLMVMFTQSILAEEMYAPEKINPYDLRYIQIDDDLLIDTKSIEIINEYNQKNEPVEIITGIISALRNYPNGSYAIPIFRLSIDGSECSSMFNEENDRKASVLMSFLNGKSIKMSQLDLSREFDRRVYANLCFKGNSK